MSIQDIKLGAVFGEAAGYVAPVFGIAGLILSVYKAKKESEQPEGDSRIEDVKVSSKSKL